MARAKDQFSESTAISLEMLYRRYARWLDWKLKRRFGPQINECSEDLVQETYLRIAAYDGVSVVRHPRALLFRVASNLALNQLRRSKRANYCAGCIEDVAESDEHSAAAVQDETVLLRQIVCALPPPLREVFVLSRFAGMTNQDIAAKCGISVKTVEWRMTKALSLITMRLRG
jgi:RNA polymerase sigma factor (sigma-70 family)